MSPNPSIPALEKVIRSFKTPVSLDELVAETTALLAYEGQAATVESVLLAIKDAAEAGSAAIVNAMQPDGSFQVALEPPKLLVLSPELAIPLAIAKRADFLTYHSYMKKKRAAEIAALKNNKVPF